VSWYDFSSFDPFQGDMGESPATCASCGEKKRYILISSDQASEEYETVCMNPKCNSWDNPEVGKLFF